MWGHLGRVWQDFREGWGAPECPFFFATLHCRNNFCIKQVHERTSRCGSVPAGQRQPCTGGFVCSFLGEKRARERERERERETVSMGLLLFELETANAQGAPADRIPGPSVSHIPQRFTRYNVNKSLLCSCLLPRRPQRCVYVLRDVFIKATVFRADDWESGLGLRRRACSDPDIIFI